MSKESNNQGRAYEYVFLLTLADAIKKIRDVQIEQNSAYFAAEQAFLLIDDTLKPVLQTSAQATIEKLFAMEPMIIEPANDTLTLKVQTDKKGKEGDVRDIVIARSAVRWEIGLSLKHNHFAAKHSRLAKTLDFGKKWFQIPCSENYWKSVKPIFDYLRAQKLAGKKWNELPNKDQDVYIPLLQAFKDEVLQSYQKDETVPQKMVEYLLGTFDFYKVISVDKKQLTQIQSYNLHGQLNKESKVVKSKIQVPITYLPTRIVNIGMKPNSSTTVELYMDGGWQFGFRIHNASEYVETSLKFDIQIVGMPITILSINCFWDR